MLRITQSDRGKAFEFSLAMAMRGIIAEHKLRADLAEDNAFHDARSRHEKIPDKIRLDFDSAATAAVVVLAESEPRMLSADYQPFVVRIQSDTAGQHGDVRDIVLSGRDGWEFGVSAKNRNAVVKNPRLSDKDDFARKWFGVCVSDNYREKIQPVFDELRASAKRGELFREIADKERRIYSPVLDAFESEVKRIVALHKNASARLLHYLLGVNDFYKVIKENGDLLIQGFNINGNLGLPIPGSGGRKKIKQLRMPDRVDSVLRKEKSGNTSIINFNHGWEMSFRLHNATTRVEPSLKFDIRLIGHPHGLYSKSAEWKNPINRKTNER